MKALSYFAAALVVVIILFVGKAGFSVSAEAQPKDVTPGATAEAAPTPAPDPGAAEAEDYLFKLLGGIPATLSVAALGGIVAAVVNLAKLTGKAGFLDGNTAKLVIVVNAVVYVVFYFANLLGVGDQLKAFFEKAGPLLPVLVTALAMLGGSNVVHQLMKRFDPVAFSLTAQKVKPAQLPG